MIENYYQHISGNRHRAERRRDALTGLFALLLFGYLLLVGTTCPSNGAPAAAYCPPPAVHP